MVTVQDVFNQELHFKNVTQSYTGLYFICWLKTQLDPWLKIAISSESWVNHPSQWGKSNKYKKRERKRHSQQLCVTFRSLSDMICWFPWPVWCVLLLHLLLVCHGHQHDSHFLPLPGWLQASHTQVKGLGCPSHLSLHFSACLHFLFTDLPSPSLLALKPAFQMQWGGTTTSD